jgi:7-cyano-7-deazaguanine synthase
LILLSGGIDSTAAVALAVAENHRCRSMFVDYGQAAATAEDSASAAVAAHFGVRRQVLKMTGLAFGAGEIRGRNAFLINAALLGFPAQAGTIVIGIHAGTGYDDCGEAFVALMQQTLDFHTGGAIGLVAPFIHAGKRDVFAIAEDLQVPVDLTFSCEAAAEPCGECLSCRDRADLAVH